VGTDTKCYRTCPTSILERVNDYVFVLFVFIKTLEVRVMNIINFTRQVLECKDRVGAVRRIAAYTDSRGLPGAATGRVLRWRNPRFHYFMDGSSGARVEEENLPDITISDN